MRIMIIIKDNNIKNVFILFCSYFETYKMYNFNDLQVFYFDWILLNFNFKK